MSNEARSGRPDGLSVKNQVSAFVFRYEFDSRCGWCENIKANFGFFWHCDPVSFATFSYPEGRPPEQFSCSFLTPEVILVNAKPVNHTVKLVSMQNLLFLLLPQRNRRDCRPCLKSSRSYFTATKLRNS